MSRRSTRFLRTRPMRPRPRLFAPNARFVRLASSTPWPTASVRAYGAVPPSGSAGGSFGNGVSQPDFLAAALAVAVVGVVVPLALTVVVVVGGVVVVGAPSVQGTGFQGSGCVL